MLTFEVALVIVCYFLAGISFAMTLQAATEYKLTLALIILLWPLLVLWVVGSIVRDFIKPERGEPVPPLSRTPLGWHCFACGKPTWMHRAPKDDQR